MKVRIERKTHAATDICRFVLVALDGGTLPSFTAGAHIDVHLEGGLIRQYSLSGSPSERVSYELGVLLEPNSRGGSRAMHALSEGDVIEISAPRNHFALADAAAHSILIAGGIGVTPILSMARELDAAGASFDLHYLLRDPERHAFRDPLDLAPLATRVSTYFDSDTTGRCDLGAVLAAPAAGTHLYACGPAGMIEAVVSLARAAGWPEQQIHREFFAAPVVTHESSGPFEIRLARSGRVIQVSAEQTALDALLRAGIEVQTSCEQGVCGTCLTPVIDGEPDHRDMYLTDDERARNDQFLPCCSRSKTTLLTIDA